MRNLLRKCPVCNVYTLRQKCPSCNNKTVSPHPAKFSPDDRYARYRVEGKYSGEARS